MEQIECVRAIDHYLIGMQAYNRAISNLVCSLTKSDYKNSRYFLKKALKLPGLSESDREYAEMIIRDISEKLTKI